MMHYADVDKFTLKDIQNDELPIRINGSQYTIKWHPDHAKTVKKFVTVCATQTKKFRWYEA